MSAPVSSEILRRLAGLSLPPGAMAEVLSILADVQEADESRRLKQRNRKKKSRDADVTVTGHCRDRHDDVTGHACDSHVTVTGNDVDVRADTPNVAETGACVSIPSDAESPTLVAVSAADDENALSYLLTSKSNRIPEKQQEKEEKKKRAKPTRGELVPDDWKPNAGHFAAGEKLGYSRSQVLAQAEDIRLWSHSNANRAVARKSNWDMAFLVWLRRADNGGGGSGGRGPPPKPGYADFALELYRKIKDERDSQDDPEDQSFAGHGPERARRP